MKTSLIAFLLMVAFGPALSSGAYQNAGRVYIKTLSAGELPEAGYDQEISVPKGIFLIEVIDRIGGYLMGEARCDQEQCHLLISSDQPGLPRCYSEDIDCGLEKLYSADFPDEGTRLYLRLKETSLMPSHFLETFLPRRVHIKDWHYSGATKIDVPESVNTLRFTALGTVNLPFRFSSTTHLSNMTLEGDILSIDELNNLGSISYLEANWPNAAFDICRLKSGLIDTVVMDLEISGLSGNCLTSGLTNFAEEALFWLTCTEEKFGEILATWQRSNDARRSILCANFFNTELEPSLEIQKLATRIQETFNIRVSF